jgi:hypothetical protein
MFIEGYGKGYGDGSRASEVLLHVPLNIQEQPEVGAVLLGDKSHLLVRHRHLSV